MGNTKKAVEKAAAALAVVPNENPFPVGYRGRIDPNKLLVIVDPKHPRYDERVALPLDEVMTASVKKHGVMMEVVVVYRDGQLEVEDGRRRVLHARAAASKDIPFVVKACEKDDVDSVLLSHELNAVRLAPNVMAQARAAKIALDAGKKREAVARAMGRDVKALKDLLNLIEKASPAVTKAVEAGTLSGTSAIELATRPHAEQDAIVDAAAKIAADALANDRTGKRKAIEGAPVIATRDVYAAIAAAQGRDIAPSLQRSGTGSSPKKTTPKAHGDQQPAPTGPRTGTPKADELAAIFSALKASAIAPDLTPEQRNAMQGAWAVLAFCIDGTPPTPASAGKFPALNAALLTMRGGK